MSTMKAIGFSDRKVVAMCPPMIEERHDREIARRLLAAALYNYHCALTSPEEVSLKSWNELQPTQREFLERWAVSQAMQAIWQGR